jgi:hypothetical protein
MPGRSDETRESTQAGKDNIQLRGNYQHHARRRDNGDNNWNSMAEPADIAGKNDPGGDAVAQNMNQQVRHSSTSVVSLSAYDNSSVSNVCQATKSTDTG